MHSVDKQMFSGWRSINSFTFQWQQGYESHRNRCHSTLICFMLLEVSFKADYVTAWFWCIPTPTVFAPHSHLLMMTSKSVHFNTTESPSSHLHIPFSLQLNLSRWPQMGIKAPINLVASVWGCSPGKKKVHPFSFQRFYVSGHNWKLSGPQN